MDIEILWEVFRVTCYAMSLTILINFCIRTYRLIKAKFGTFYVKTGFAFERGEQLLGQLRYYRECDIQRALSENQTTLGEYVKSFIPLVNLPFETLSHLEMNSVGLPVRVKIKAEIVNKYGTIAVVSKSTFLVLNRLGPDPRNCVWFGTCIISNNEDMIKVIEHKYRKANKHDSDCYVVRT